MPPPEVAVLPDTVLFSRLTLPYQLYMPPPVLPVLPEIVLFTIVVVPKTLDKPPPEKFAVLFAIVLFSTLRVPEVRTPPPALPEIVLCLILSFPELDTPPASSSTQSHTLKRQIEIASHGDETEVGRVCLASNDGAVTFNSDPDL